MIDALIILMLLLVGAGGTAVVLTRDLVNQVIVLGVYGVLLTFLFTLLHAPDVALSEVGVGGVAVPAMVILALVRMRRRSSQAATPPQ